MPITGNRPRLGSRPGRCKVDEGDRAMNRAWIPAGALAGVSVAGLIALGPLTDSLTPPVTFSSVVTVAAPQRTFQPARVSYNAGPQGQTRNDPTAPRGGRSVVDANAAAGEVAYAKKPAPQPRATPTTSAAPPPAPSPPPAKTQKKTV